MNHEDMVLMVMGNAKKSPRKKVEKQIVSRET